MEYHLTYLSLATIFGFAMAWGIGANDVSNAMGTSVGSKAISIKQAIVIAAIFEFAGAFLAGSEVTNTIRHSLIEPTYMLLNPNTLILGMLSALLASAIWLLLASFFGWPVSTTHTITGAVVGFGATYFGVEAIQWRSVLSILLAWVCSPLLGASFAFFLFLSIQKLIFNKRNPILAAKKIAPVYIFFASVLVIIFTLVNATHLGWYLSWWQVLILASCFGGVFAFIGRLAISRLDLKLKEKNRHSFRKQYHQVEKIFGVLMLFTACAMAFAHGSNDVANAIGPVAAIAEFAQSGKKLSLHTVVPSWVLLMGATGIVLGLATYGYRVMTTVGSGITQLTPSRGFAATLSAAGTVVLASSIGFPISTTHTLVGGILGVGLARGLAALNLQVIGRIFMSWAVTLPAGALLSILLFKCLEWLFLFIGAS